MGKANPLAVLLLLVTSLILLFSSSTEISDEELETAIYSLQSRGYRLFGNAITSSDVRFDLLLSNASFTLFAPTDATIFALDMVLCASSYVGVLRHHVALGRHSLPALRALIPGTSIPTLLSSAQIVISKRDSLDIITVDGVDVALPGLFYGQNLAVHGLAGIQTQRTVQESETPPPGLRSHDSHHAPANSPDYRSRQSVSEVPEWRKPKRASAMDPALVWTHSPAPASNFEETTTPPRISTAERGSPEGSLAPKRAGGSSGIFSSPAMPPNAYEISDSSPAAASAAFPWAYGTCRDTEDLSSSPASDLAAEHGRVCEHRGNQHSHLLFCKDEANL